MKPRFAVGSLVVAAILAAAGYGYSVAKEPVARPIPMPSAVINTSESNCTVFASPAEAVLQMQKGAAKHVTTQQYRLKNIDAREAAQKINLAVADTKSTVHVEGVVVQGALVIVPVYDTNSLTVVANAEHQARVSKLISELDAPRTQVVVQCSITRTSPDGKVDIVSRPQIRTLDGQKATIRIGEGTDETFEFSVTPRVILPEDSGNTARSGSGR